ncbi:MAG: HEAT repeat domain-containing protein [Planctomycetota bacterium]
MKKVLLISIIIFLCAIFSIIIIAESPSQDLETGIKKKDNNLIKKAVEELVQQNDEKALNALTEALNLLGTPPKDTSVYWTILEGIGRLTNKDVISKLSDFIINNKNKDLSSDLLAAMKANRTSTVVPLLSNLLEKGNYEMRLECIHQLGAIYAKESLEALLNYLRPLKSDDKDKKELIKNAISALKNITGIDKGNYPESWIQWWDENKHKDASELIRPKGTTTNIEHVGQYRDMKGIETLPKEKVLVLKNDKCDKVFVGKGNYDKIEDILSKLGIPHTVIGKSEFDKDSYSLDDKWAIVINCNFFKEHCCSPEHAKMKPTGQKGGVERTVVCPGQDKHENHNTKLSDKTIQKIKNFVETGGYLFTEDLNIEEVNERAFKGYITHTKFIPEKVVKIVPAPGAALHPYLKYVFEVPPSSSNQTPSEGKSGETTSVKQQDFRIDAEWKIDNESPDIKILKKDTVTVLIVSPQLAKENKSEGAVAVTWSYGKPVVLTGSNKPTYMPGGRVLHVMSHFGKQRSKLDEFALQNLIVNFFVELNEQRPKGKKN